MAQPYSSVPDYGFQLAAIHWYRWNGAAKPGHWSVSFPSFRDGITFHRCVIDDFGTLVEVPA